ncbi:MAG: exo-alpha-sialidase [Deltaproteobacteria bacterium]|nr:exo-alpha-sialidase [Deltaproteobacteria bacterium]
MKTRTAALLMAAACLLHAWAALRWFASPLYSSSTLRFAQAVPPPESQDNPCLVEEFINAPSEGHSVHAASLCELSGGRLAAAWYGGSREGGRDVSVYFAEKSPGNDGRWAAPRPVVNAASASRELDRYVKKVGNPVIFSEPGDQVWLLFVTVSVGGWSGSSLNLKTSKDSGKTWSESRRLTLSPFFNVSELVRNRPVPLEGGILAVPVYHEFLGRFPEVLWLAPASSARGHTYRKSRMAGGRRYIQPSIVPLGPNRAVAFYRNMSEDRTVVMATSNDSGLSWSPPRPTPLPNPNSGLQAILLPSQRVLIAFNDSRRERDNLTLAISEDGGASWKRIAVMENTPGAEFSYPYMIRDGKGWTHLVYTWHRKRIKHVAFNDSWIEAHAGGAIP